MTEGGNVRKRQTDEGVDLVSRSGAYGNDGEGERPKKTETDEGVDLVSRSVAYGNDGRRKCGDDEERENDGDRLGSLTMLDNLLMTLTIASLSLHATSFRRSFTPGVPSGSFTRHAPRRSL